MIDVPAAAAGPYKKRQLTSFEYQLSEWLKTRCMTSARAFALTRAPMSVTTTDTSPANNLRP